MSLDEYFSTGPERERPIFEAVMARLEPVGPIHVEPVSVGIFLKRARTFAELRPMVKWESLSFVMSRTIDHPSISRRLRGSPGRTWHVVRLYGPDDVDDDIGAWLVESYLASPA